MSFKPNAKIILTAGGTGGHIFPAVCLYKELKKRNLTPLFVTDIRGDSYIKEDVNKHVLSIQRNGLFRYLKSLYKAIRECNKLFKHDKPDAVICFGGYPSIAGGLAAFNHHLPLVLHEQNAIMGKSNRLLTKISSKVAVSYPQTRRLKTTKPIILTGNPVRDEIENLFHEAYSPPQQDEPFNILIIGGSQGAAVFSSWIPEAIKELPADIQTRLVITQQCRSELFDQTHENYKGLHCRYHLLPFIEDMVGELRKAHLVITRSGSVLNEIALAKKPVIMFPYPYAADDHQYENAKYYEESNGGWIINEKKQSPRDLQLLLEYLMKNPSLLQLTSNKIASLAFTGATQKLANAIEDIIPPRK